MKFLVAGAGAIGSLALLWLTPFLSLLEGCDQVASTSRFRLLQSVAGFAAFWAVLGCGGALWAVAAQSGVNLLGAGVQR